MVCKPLKGEASSGLRYFRSTRLFKGMLAELVFRARKTAGVASRRLDDADRVGRGHLRFVIADGADVNHGRDQRYSDN